MGFFVVQSISCVWLFATPWTVYSMPSFPVLHYIPKFAYIRVHWVCDAIQPSHALSSFCLQSFPASESFPVSQLFASDGQIIWASASVLPMDTQGWFHLRLSGLISLLPKGLSRGILMHIFLISFGVYMYGFIQTIGIIVSFILLNSNFVLKYFPWN